MSIRLHILAIPHTITRKEFSHCAYTGKVLRFSPMMRARGFEVYHYGVETSESGATKEIELMTNTEWSTLRTISYCQLHPEKSLEDAEKHLSDPASFIGDLGNWGTPLYTVFNERLRQELPKYYRSKSTDIVCIPFGQSHNAALNGLDVVKVESGIGYPDSTELFRIFESYAWMHSEIAKGNRNVEYYWFVAPNYFASHDWPLSLSPKIDTVGFLGRICHSKGCTEIVEIARRMPHVQFVLCGQGDPREFLLLPNIQYMQPIHGDERASFLGSLIACLAPTRFLEPFCGVAVEAQLCGTPVLTTDFGAQTETVEQGVTGLRCHTLEDYCEGIRMAQSNVFDRTYIRNRAVALYSLEAVGPKYEYAFRCIMDVYNTNKGWHSPVSHIREIVKR